MGHPATPWPACARVRARMRAHATSLPEQAGEEAVRIAGGARAVEHQRYADGGAPKRVDRQSSGVIVDHLPLRPGPFAVEARAVAGRAELDGRLVLRTVHRPDVYGAVPVAHDDAARDGPGTVDVVERALIVEADRIAVETAVQGVEGQLRISVDHD